jgi:CRISPR-associated protein (TIGR03984 family)
MMAIRTLEQGAGLSCKTFSLDATEQTVLRADLLRCWGDNGSGWLLGHDLDGLIWGHIANGTIVIAHDIQVSEPPFVFSTPVYTSWGAPLRFATLQDLRIFNEHTELRIWRKHNKLQACRVTEKDGESGYYCDENQILIAGHCLKQQKSNGTVFSFIQGPAGQKQALPVDWDGTGQRYRLQVRHYFDTDQTTGMLHVSDSRLLGLINQGGN